MWDGTKLGFNLSEKENEGWQRGCSTVLLGASTTFCGMLLVSAAGASKFKLPRRRKPGSSSVPPGCLSGVSIAGQIWLPLLATVDGHSPCSALQGK
jgi:hypothetical protein